MNQTDSCPICLNEKENFKLLEHFEDQDGDVSSHKMCNTRKISRSRRFLLL